MPTIYQIVTIALISAFVIQFIDKVGLRNLVIERAGYFVSNAFSCDFCLSFWTNLLVCILLVLITGNYALFVVPFMSVPITRILI